MDFEEGQGHQYCCPQIEQARFYAPPLAVYSPLAMSLHWSFPRTIENQGQDVLGIRAVDLRLETSLTPGVTSITQRVRFYSLFTWAIQQVWNIHEQGGEVKISKRAYRRHFERLNLAVILATLLDAPSLKGIVGRNSVAKAMPPVDQELDLDALHAARKPQQARRVYLPPLVDMSLIREQKDQHFLTPMGKQLAEVTAGMPGLDALQLVLETGRIPAGEITKHSADWSLAALSREQNSEERAALVTVLYGAPVPEGGQGRKRSQVRSATAALFLHHASREAEDLSSLGAGWDEEEVAGWLAMPEWFYLLRSPESDPQLPARLLPLARAFRCLQARRALHELLEHMLNEALYKLPGDTSMPRDAWPARCLQDPADEAPPWMPLLGMAYPAWDTPVTAWLTPLDQALGPEHSPAFAVAHDQTVDEENMATFLLAALAEAAWLWRLTRQDEHAFYKVLAPPVVSLSNWARMEQSWARAGATVREACAEFLDLWSLRQHRYNALRKLREDMQCTLRFHEEDGQVWRVDLPIKPGNSGLRSGAVWLHLEDLGLWDDDWQLTGDGRRHLDRLLAGEAT